MPRETSAPVPGTSSINSVNSYTNVFESLRLLADSNRPAAVSRVLSYMRRFVYSTPRSPLRRPGFPLNSLPEAI